ncbi:hypothetical protein M5236_004055 [Vibrio parahaemolyticus]|nr:hypothetical protein [Vibrio parahaemolyticus]
MQKRWLALSVASVLVGCSSTPPPTPTPPPLNIRTAPELTSGQAVHTSRYVTQSRASGAELTDILGVPIDAHLPVMPQMTVKQGMEFLLTGSGMSLRTPTSEAEAQLYAQSLPLGQTDMGHMRLREALQVMGGQAFSLEEDVVRREVGFELKDGYVWQAPPRVSRVAAHTQQSSDNDEVAMTPRLSRTLSTQPSSTSSSHLDNTDALFTGIGASTAKSTSAMSKSAKEPSQKANGNQNFFIAGGEAPYRAIQRWLNQSKVTKVAYGLSEGQQALLLKPMARPANFRGTLPDAIQHLGKTLDMPLRFDMQRGIGAVHTLTSTPDIQWVHGSTLKVAVANLARAYGWHWNSEGAQASWMSENDYPLMSEFGVVTPRDAFDLALDTVLDGYPVQAQLISSTRSVFIREKE